jgi:hypothetical protein
LIARPTPVGERVWIYLRPGLSVNELQNRVDKIAVACHASTVIVDRASARTAALVRVDVKRREVLGALVNAPLAGMVTPSPLYDTQRANFAALDLADIPVAEAKPGRTAAPSPRPTPPAEPVPATVVPIRPTTAQGSVKKVPATVAAGEDLSDWID